MTQSLKDDIMLVLLLISLFVAGYAIGHTQSAAATQRNYDPFLQRNFPCEEDEALLYHPKFGTERVGCAHIEGIEVR